MPNLSIKDVPEAWAEILRQRAASNHRSLQGELMALIEAAVSSTDASTGVARPEWSRLPQGKSTVEEVLARIALIVPPGEARLQAAALPTGGDIIRAERDAR